MVAVSDWLSGSDWSYDSLDVWLPVALLMLVFSSLCIYFKPM